MLWATISSRINHIGDKNVGQQLFSNGVSGTYTLSADEKRKVFPFVPGSLNIGLSRPSLDYVIEFGGILKLIYM